MTMRDRTWKPRESATLGHLLAAALVVVSFGLSLAAPGARLVYYAFPVASTIITIELLRRRCWYSYLSFVAWLWFLSPFLRRVIDWKTTYHQSSVILLAPAIAGLLAIPIALMHRRTVDKIIGRLFVFAAVVFVYGALIGVFRNGARPVIVDVFAVLGPFGAGLFALTVPSDPVKLRKAVISICVWGSIVMGAYGLIQFLVVPPWDAQWIVDTGITTVGKPVPGQIRVFSTINTSQPFGEVIAATVLVALAERRILLRAAAVLFGFIALGVSLVRAAWLALAVAFVGLINNNRVRVATALGVVAVGLVGLLAFGGSITSSVSERVNNSVSAGSNDTSFNARFEFQKTILGPTLSDPVGEGMGSTGAALRTQGDAFVGGTDKRLANFDSGIFENATVYGSVLGFILFFWLIYACVAAWRRSRKGAYEVAFCASAVTMLVVSMFATNTIQNAPGYLLWVLLAVCARAAGETRVAEARRTVAVTPVPASRALTERARVSLLKPAPVQRPGRVARAGALEPRLVPSQPSPSGVTHSLSQAGVGARAPRPLNRPRA